MNGSWTVPDPGEWRGNADLHRFVICDVFTSDALAGNQLAVFVDGRQLSGEQMQALARETNFAETVYLLPPDSGGHARMRIFTPRQELPFAGHPVLGTAVVVGQATGHDAVTLETGAGLVSLTLERIDGRITFGWMAQPIPEVSSYGRVEDLLAALGVTTTALPVQRYNNGPDHVLVALASEDEVAALRPDMARLEELGSPVSCFAGHGRFWKTRMFYPAGGVPEDPATGSAAGPVALHLARHGRLAYGERIDLRQGEEIGRPSYLSAIVRGHGDEVESISVGGSAVIVAAGDYRVTT